MIPDDVIIRAGTNMLAHTDMVPLEYVRQALAEARKDTERLTALAWPEPFCDQYGDVDIHHCAAIIAIPSGRDEANKDDYLAAVRYAIDQVTQSRLNDAAAHGK